jgi:GT2 family glycosyltransferase
MSVSQGVAPAREILAAPAALKMNGPAPPEPAERVRLTARGKFLYAGDRKYFVKGVTYGSFRRDEEGREYWNAAAIERDFALMAKNGFNSVRIPHTMPPRALLDTADRHGLRVMVGLSAEQYVGYLIDREKAPDIQKIVREKVRAVAGHPALLCYAIGNEVPAQMARWLGRGRVERYLRKMYDAIKEEDPGGLVTYVNSPSTEYLDLPFLDLLAFNVYLEAEDRLDAYLARLQNLAGNRPLLMSEVGLDSLRNGEITQADVLTWQIETIFRAGCIGAFVFAWTDEWHRETEVTDWEFGLTRRDRSPKPALAAVRETFSKASAGAKAPAAPSKEFPLVSVVVCSYNGSRTLRECLEHVLRIDYPSYEVLVVDDGSEDGTASIAAEYPVRLLRTPNRGLSNARNLGWEEARGEIVAFIDDDAFPDQDWLKYLVQTFLTTDFVGVGGPNIAPPGDGPIAACVANSPGGPAHVLLTDREAEHIPGCNMAFRRSALQAVGGFDPQFRVAGDDVDLCWRLQAQHWKLGFSPAAQVWHHSRNSIRAFWRQQKERKWPEKYNAAGHLTWSGRVYAGAAACLGARAGRIYHGQWGSAPFQSMYEGPMSLWQSLPLIPEWHLANLALLLMALMGTVWRPLLLAIPLLAVSASGPLIYNWRLVARARFPRCYGPASRLRAITFFLYSMQPLARLLGRLLHGLTPWRRRARTGFASPLPHQFAVFSKRWLELDKRLEGIESVLRALGAPVRRGETYDRWDLEVEGGVWGAARVIMATEDCPGQTQYLRYRVWPRVPATACANVLVLAALSLLAAWNGSPVVTGVLAAIALLFAMLILWQTSAAMGALRTAISAVF